MAFVADDQSPELVDPCECYLDDPSVLSEVAAAFDAPSCDSRRARLDGRFPRLNGKLIRVPLLIFDDFGAHSLSDEQRFHLFEIVEERYRRKSTVITAQTPWQDGMISLPTPPDPGSEENDIPAARCA